MVLVGKRELEIGQIFTYKGKDEGDVATAEVLAGADGKGLVLVTRRDGTQETVKSFTAAARAIGLVQFDIWGLPELSPKAPAEPKASAPPADGQSEATEKPKRGRKAKAVASEAEAEPTPEPTESNDPVDLFE